MGNSLEPEQEGSWGGTKIAEEDFARIKAAGFDTVRIPVRWHNKSLDQAPYTVDAAWMDRVDEVVSWALAADLNVILNSHHFDPIYENPEGVAAWHGGVWEQIAARFADAPEDRLWFELENEPHNKLDHSNLLDTLAPALAAVRATNPTRAVIYGGENWSGINSLATLPLPGDANIYPTFHYYDPFEFTHQGASWTEPNMPPPGRKFGSAADLQQLSDDADKVRAYTARTGKLPFMGETGAYDKHISVPERAAYHRAVREAFAPTGVGICTWAYANTFPFFDQQSGQWVPGLRAAMGLEEPGTSAQTQASPDVPQADEAGEPAGRRLPKALQDFDAQLPGWLVNDPTSLAMVSYGDTLSREPIVDEAIPGGGAALRFSNTRAGDPWSAGSNVPLLADIEEGRRITIGFFARTLHGGAADGLGRVSVRFQQDAYPYPGFGDRTLSIGKEWQFYEVSAVADRKIARRAAVVAMQFGAQEQIVEIGQIIVVVGAASIIG
ncbi:glycoside hydrolase family 5 protein [Qipengyuania marisflavi]|uniref:Glycoside hydrolase family 5 protein n=2 Tax=Qipengyuania marisflavi TaxID=2486356 RepID=A0A5S3NY88_9SPHN|nr:glycoside hydrolase family 5 protein [Qipengyuania marisflavi]